MKDFFGNELRIGQEVAYSHSINVHGKSISRRGIIVSFKQIKYGSDHINGNFPQKGIVNIKSLETGKTVSRYSDEIIGNGHTLSREAFFEGENHL